MPGRQLFNTLLGELLHRLYTVAAIVPGELQGITDRRAHYYCVLVLVHHADDPQPLIAEGEWHGEIAHDELGDGGFGYDPLFWMPELGKMCP